MMTTKQLFFNYKLFLPKKVWLLTIVMLISFYNLSAQQVKVIKGTVTSVKEGTPLPGVNVLIKGTSTGVVTDFNGQYSINASPNNVLTFTYLGFQNQEIAVGNQTQINISLAEDTTSLDEVIVIGYGTMKKSDFTGAVSSVKVDQLNKSTDASMAQLLKGKAAGVTVQSTNALPGGGISVLIRGAASTGAGNDPLYVIDGFPVSNSTLEPGSGNSNYAAGERNALNALNPNDIESIEILKDASATAIYGARGANGVILVTTKRGRSGLKVEYSSNFSMQNLDNPFKMLDATQFMKLHNSETKERWLVANGIAPYGTNNPSGASAGPFYKYTQDQINNAGKGTDWFKQVTRTGIVNNHNLSFSAGNDDVKSYVSLGYFKNDGVVKNTAFERYTTKINLDWNVNKYIKTGVSYLGSLINNKNAQNGEQQWGASGMMLSGLLFDPTLPVRDDNGNYSTIAQIADLPNPLSYLEVDDNTKQTRSLINVYAELYPVENLTIRGSVGYDGQAAARKTYYPTTFLFGKLSNGTATIGQVNRDDYLMDVTANYKLELDNHKLDLLAGNSFQQFTDNGFSMNVTNFFTDAFTFNNMGAAANRANIGSYANTSKLLSYFGRLNYTLNDKYLLTVTARYDGSDKFGTDNKWAFFPSAAVAWKISEEKFMSQLEAVSRLKIRASWGQTGNSNIGSNAFPFYDVNRTYVFNNLPVPGVSLSQLENPALKWETTEEVNLGLDFELFQGRVSGSFEYYNKSVKDLLGFRNLRPWMSLSGVAANLGSTKSEGYEVSLSTVNIDKEVKWVTDFTFTKYTDRWKERSPDVVLAPWESVDDPIRAIFDYQTDGLVQVGEVVPHMPNALPGNVKVRDVNGFDGDLNYTGAPDGKIDQADIVFLGSWDPGYSVGINSTVKYKGIDFTVYGYGMFERTVFNNSLIKFVDWSENLTGHGTNLRVEAFDIWSSDNQDGIYPSTAPNYTPGSGAWAYGNAAFFRIRNITLGYSLPSKLLGKSLSSLRVYFDAQNPFVFTKWNGMDPETDGGSMAPYPNQKSFTVGINVQL